MSVDFQKAEYTESLKIWKLVRDASSGEQAIKKGGEIYLPNFTRLNNNTITNGDENIRTTGNENQERYKQYKRRAIYYNFTGRTVAGLVGLLFNKGITLTEGDDDYLLSDVNGSGLTLDQQMRKVAKNDIEVGRDLLIVDFPQTNGVVTMDQASDRRATVQRYPAENAINWWEDNGKLSLVVVREIVMELSDDGFTQEEKIFYRVFRLVEGLYVQELYEGNDLVDSFEPRDSTGARLDFIPALFVGSENNEPNIDSPPMLDIANVNIGHYRNSADFENSSWLVGQPIPWFTGLTQAWVEQYYPTGITLGSGAAVLGPEGSQFGVETADPNTMAMDGMKHKEASMQALGAQMLTSESANSATEAVIDMASEMSIMMQIKGNLEEAYNKCFEWVSVFNGTEPLTVSINADLSQMSINPQMAQVMVEAWTRGLVAATDARDSLRVAGLVKRSEEEIEDEIDSTLNLDK